jgi:heat-inducible transcriptional repressor
MTLDERKANILRAVVEEYIETAVPVGSSHVARAPGVHVSSATVRNDMAVLEQEGYIVQPHTSAGRIPTEKGYRFFVDGLDVPTKLAAGDAQQVRSFFAQAHGELERMLADTSRLLAGLTHYAAVVVGSPRDDATIRSVQLVGLGGRVAVLVLVLSDGSIEKRTIELPADEDADTLTAAGLRLTAKLTGSTMSEAAAAAATQRAAGPVAEPDEIERIVTVAAAAVTAESTPDASVFIGGASGMASAFDAVAQVSEILRILEQQFVVVSLLKDVLDRGLNVAIGTETGIQPLADCAVIVSPYVVDGEVAGTVGVLGPARMNYQQALAAVGVVSTRLGRRLSEG